MSPLASVGFAIQVKHIHFITHLYDGWVGQDTGPQFLEVAQGSMHFPLSLSTLLNSECKPKFNGYALGVLFPSRGCEEGREGFCPWIPHSRMGAASCPVTPGEHC